MQQLTMRFDRFLCKGCNVVAHHELRMMCDTCHEDYMHILDLYNVIVRQYPRYKTLTPHELFVRMYQAILKKGSKK